MRLVCNWLRMTGMQTTDFYKDLVFNTPSAYAYHRMLLDDCGVPFDYEFLEVNRAFEKMTGLPAHKIVGQRVSHVFPNILADGFDWIGFYGKVALNGGQVQTEQYSDTLNRWYLIHVISTAPHHFATFVSDITTSKNERKQIAEELIKSEVRYNHLFNSMDSCVAVYEVVDNGEDFVFLDINSAVERHEKIKRQDLIGKRVTEAFPGVKSFGLLDVFKRVWQTGKSEYHPISHYQDTRLEGWRDNHVYKLSEKEIVAIYRDVTEKKRAEIRLKTVFESIEDGILVADAETHVFSEANERICTMLGYTREELFRLSIEDIHPQDTLPMLAEKFEMQRKGLIRVIHDIPVKRKDGSIFYADIGANEVNMDGRPSMMGVFRDITEYKALRQTLVEREERYRSLISSMSEGVLVRNLQGEIIETNSALERIFGLTFAEIEALYNGAKDIQCTLIDENEEAFDVDQAPSRRVLKTGAPVYNTVVGIRCQTTTRWVVVNSDPIFNREGNLIGSVSVFSDITDLKNAKEIAEAASYTKSRFLATVSHELRTPLNPILGLSDLLLSQDTLVAEDRECLELINRGAKSLDRIIQDLLELASIDVGKMKMDNEFFSLHDFVHALESQFTHEAQRKDLFLKFSIQEGTIDVIRSNPSALQRIVVHLLDNALKFTQQGGVTVDVSIKEKNHVSHLCIVVADTGIGIPQEMLHSVFDMFTQADNSASRKYEGLGMGLSIVSKIVNLLEGTIKVNSELNKGSSFVICVPVRIEEWNLR